MITSINVAPVYDYNNDYEEQDRHIENAAKGINDIARYVAYSTECFNESYSIEEQVDLIDEAIDEVTDAFYRGRLYIEQTTDDSIKYFLDDVVFVEVVFNGIDHEFCLRRKMNDNAKFETIQIATSKIMDAIPEDIFIEDEIFVIAFVSFIDDCNTIANYIFK